MNFGRTLQALRRWWSALFAITELHELGEAESTLGDHPKYSLAMLHWWACALNEWFQVRDGLLFAVTRSLDLDVPRPEDLRAGDVYVFERLVGSRSFVYLGLE